MSRNSRPTHPDGRSRFVSVVVAAVLVIVLVTAYIGVRLMTAPAEQDYVGNGNGVVELVEIAPGSSVSALGPELVERGIVKSNSAFQRAASENSDAANVQPGYYRLEGEMSAEAAVAALLDPGHKVELLQVQPGATINDVVVVGGSTRLGIFSQISQLACGQAANSNCVTVAKLNDAAAFTPPAELGVPEWAIDQVTARGTDPRRIEGLIAPGEYVVNPTAQAKDILRELLTKSAKVWDETGIIDKASQSQFTPYELLTAASLVERESPAGEFRKVARVIVNRLAVPMRLEFDSTVNYDLADQEVATTDEDRARVTAWNTYAADGLPATPIASPSVEALEAMEDPEPGDWLFFVTVDQDGTTVFNNTFEEHMNSTGQAVDNGVLDSQREQ
ncbi:endolytic transglycosylase MltG [Corynebacterium choanae]|uniref:endolytic transglycosylase MltG n=1 Tax=Corynebacterium choanae TaxID=1862358 RepID=UPI001FEB0F1F|nr:endolytic transglycosylase MltG [Corynebacterium choanae]